MFVVWLSWFDCWLNYVLLIDSDCLFGWCYFDVRLLYWSYMCNSVGAYTVISSFLNCLVLFVVSLLFTYWLLLWYCFVDTFCVFGLSSLLYCVGFGFVYCLRLFVLQVWLFRFWVISGLVVWIVVWSSVTLCL